MKFSMVVMPLEATLTWYFAVCFMHPAVIVTKLRRCSLEHNISHSLSKLLLGRQVWTAQGFSEARTCYR